MCIHIKNKQACIHTHTHKRRAKGEITMEDIENEIRTYCLQTIVNRDSDGNNGDSNKQQAWQAN